MRHPRTAIAVSAALVFAIRFVPIFLPSSLPKHAPSFAKQDRIQFAIELEKSMTADPATGEIPRERLLDARSAAADFRREAELDRSPLADIVWRERGPSNIGGRTRALLIDASDPTGQTVWAGSVGGGLWKCTNALAASPNWEKTNDALENLAISCLAQQPGSPQTLFFGTGEGWFNADAVRGAGIWKSENGGITWQRLAATANPTFYFTQKIVVTPGGTILAATRHGGIQRSTDGGLTWKKVLAKSNSACPSDRAADLERAANGDLFCSMGIFEAGGIFKSTDDGKTWLKLTNGLPAQNFHRIELAAAPSDPSRLFAMMTNGSNFDCLGIWKTDDGGASWQAVNQPKPLGMSNLCRGQAWYCMALAVDPNDKNRLLAGGIDLFETTDAGQNWQPVSHWFGGFGLPFVHADQHEIVFKTGNSATFFVGNDGGIWRGNSAAGGAKPLVSFIGNGYNVTQYYACAVGPAANSGIALAGAQDNGTQLFAGNFTPNSQNQDENQPEMASTVSGGDGGFCHIDRDEPGIQMSSGVFSTVNITNDGWATSQQFTLGSGGEGLFVNPSAYDAATNTLFMAWEMDEIGLIRHVGSQNLHEIVHLELGGSFITALTVAPKMADRLFLGLSNGDVLQVENARTAPVLSKIFNGLGWISCIAADPNNDAHLLVTYSNYGVNSVFETKNGGQNWLSVEGNLPDMPVRWAIFSPEKPEAALLATELGVWSTEKLDGPATAWLPSNGGLANVRTDMLATRPGDRLVVAATHGRGLFETRFFGGENGCQPVNCLMTSMLTDSSACPGWAAAGDAAFYEVRWRTAGSTDWQSMTCVKNVAEIYGLPPAVGHEFQVKNHCLAGESGWSASQFFLTKPPTGCLPPTELLADEIAENTARISWKMRPEAVGYELRWRKKGTGNWQKATVSQPVFELKNLAAASHFEFSVKTRGKYGESVFSEESIFGTAAAGSFCAPPNGLAATEIGPHSFKISWKAAPGQADFLVKYKIGNGGWQSKTVGQPNFSLTNLTAAGQSIQVKICASCGLSETSGFSWPLAVLLPPELACQPVGNAAAEWIESIQLAGNQRITGNDNGYGYFADAPILLEKGNSFSLKIRPGFSQNASFENYAAWLDADRDGQFDHQKELVFSQPTTKDSVVSGEIQVPFLAKNGLTHLRVMMRYSPITASCGSVAWGEVEDYAVKITGGGGSASESFGSEAAHFFDKNRAEIWPNPVRDRLFLHSPNAANASLFDLAGRLLWQFQVEPGASEWAVSWLPGGVYWLVLTDKKEQQAVKFLKK